MTMTPKVSIVWSSAVEKQIMTPSTLPTHPLIAFINEVMAIGEWVRTHAEDVPKPFPQSALWGRILHPSSDFALAFEHCTKIESVVSFKNIESGPLIGNVSFFKEPSPRPFYWIDTIHDPDVGMSITHVGCDADVVLQVKAEKHERDSLTSSLSRLTNNARTALSVANLHAQKAGYRMVTTKHVILALIENDTCAAAQLIKKLIVHHVQVQCLIKFGMRPLIDGWRLSATELPRDANLDHMLRIAESEADRLGDEHVGTEHLLLAAAFRRGPDIYEILNRLGLTYSLLDKKLHDLRPMAIRS